MQTKTLYLDIPIIGVTGSFGKTSVKELVYSVLNEEFKTYKTPRSYNMVNTTKQFASVADEYEAAVLEMAMSKKNWGRKHCTVVQPNFGVITAVGHAHFKNFKSLEDVATSKSELVKYMKQDGTLLLNIDDENIDLINTNYFPGQIITVGTSKQSMYQGTNIKFDGNGMVFNVLLNNKLEEMFVPLLGKHNVINSLFAIAIADQLGFRLESIKEGLKNVELPRGRLTLKHLENNRLIIDDSFNATPKTMEVALEIFDKYIESKNKIVLFGDIAQLGKYSQEGHEKVGKTLAKYNFDKIFLYGQNSTFIMKRAIERGIDKEKIYHFLNKRELIEKLEEEFKQDSSLLVKASGATKLNHVVNYFKSNFRQTS